MTSTPILEFDGPRGGLIIVTGAGRGIGATVAERIASLGYPVMINYGESRRAAEQVAENISAAGGSAFLCQADIGSEEGVMRLFAEADTTGFALAGLVNNAGISGGFSRLDTLSDSVLRQVLAVNVAGGVLCSREAVRRMSTRHGKQGGTIVNVSSIAAKLGSAGEWIHYAASKGAIDTLTIGLAREVAAEGIRVNAVAPGLIETAFHAAAGEPGRPERMAPSIPMERAGTSEEVADAIVWLMSRQASYITGAIVPVGGGR